MKSRLIKIFGLPRAATEADILAAATRCAKNSAERDYETEEREVIDGMMARTAGSLTRKQCKEIIRRRGGLPPKVQEHNQPA